MSFCLPTARPFDELAFVGVAMRFYKDQPHIGLLYRASDKEVVFCHLASHHMLKKEPARSDYFWSHCPWLEDDIINGPIVAGRLMSLDTKTLLPYGFEFDPTCFDANLIYQQMPVGMGLTCASFIISIFHSLQLPIIDLATWQSRPEDAVWQAGILPVINFGDPIAAAFAAKYIGSFRYRPEEVAAAATAHQPPVDFQFAINRAKAVLDDLGIG